MRAAALLIFALTAASVPVAATTPVFKCVVNGTATFQRDPCPSAAPRKPVTKEKLNAEHQKTQIQQEKTPANPATATATEQRAPILSEPSKPSSRGDSGRPPPTAAPAHPEKSQYKCDGRKYCSQMNSCAEAKYFLTHCPGVRMDGDGNGIPCERQWCNR
jgi:hypothetical protein